MISVFPSISQFQVHNFARNNLVEVQVPYPNKAQAFKDTRSVIDRLFFFSRVEPAWHWIDTRAPYEPVTRVSVSAQDFFELVEQWVIVDSVGGRAAYKFQRLQGGADSAERWLLNRASHGTIFRP